MRESSSEQGEWENQLAWVIFQPAVWWNPRQGVEPDGMLLTGIAPTFMRAQIAGTTGDSFQTAHNPLWWPPSKIAGRYLAPYLANHNPLFRDETLKDRPPSTQDSARLQASHDEARELALTFVERDAADGHFKSALEWLDVIERLDGVLPPGYVQKRAEWQGRTRE